MASYEADVTVSWHLEFVADTMEEATLKMNGIEQPLFRGPPKRRAVHELGAHEFVPGIRVGVNVDHAYRPLSGDCLRVATGTCSHLRPGRGSSLKA